MTQPLANCQDSRKLFDMRMTDAARFETRGVLAGAYRGKDIDERACLTHVVGVDADGSELFVVCRGVKLDHVTDCFGSDVNAQATCLRCVEKMARFNAKKGV